MRPNQSRGVATYLLFTFALSSVFYFLIAKSGQVGGGWGAYIGCLMWCPGVAALLSCKCLERDLSTLGWKWGKTRYEIAFKLDTINARGETLLDSKLWRSAFLQSRCLVPVDSFVEWKRIDPKTKLPWAFAMKNDESFPPSEYGATGAHRTARRAWTLSLSSQLSQMNCWSRRPVMTGCRSLLRNRIINVGWNQAARNGRLSTSFAPTIRMR